MFHSLRVRKSVDYFVKYSTAYVRSIEYFQSYEMSVRVPLNNDKQKCLYGRLGSTLQAPIERLSALKEKFCNVIKSIYNISKRCITTPKSRQTIIAFSSIIFIVLTILILLRHNFMRPTFIIVYPELNNDISCHGTEINDALKPAEDDILSREKSIFFIETSCRGGLDSRQACSVESAARANPDWNVNVLFAGPVSKQVLEGGAPGWLSDFSNVNLLRIQVAEYSKGTPLQSMFLKDTFEKSKWRVEHVSDVLKLLTLYKYGGVYLDLDMIILKSFNTLPMNFVARDSDVSVGTAILAASNDKVGRNFSRIAVNEILASYNLTAYSYNSQQLVARVLAQMCSTVNMALRSAQFCQGFHVLDAEDFFPVSWFNWQRYFHPSPRSPRAGYSHHFWNKLSAREPLRARSLLRHLAAAHCPTIYKMYATDFGS